MPTPCKQPDLKDKNAQKGKKKESEILKIIKSRFLPEKWRSNRNESSALQKDLNSEDPNSSVSICLQCSNRHVGECTHGDKTEATVYKPEKRKLTIENKLENKTKNQNEKRGSIKIENKVEQSNNESHCEKDDHTAESTKAADSKDMPCLIDDVYRGSDGHTNPSNIDTDNNGDSIQKIDDVCHGSKLIQEKSDNNVLSEIEKDSNINISNRKPCDRKSIDDVCRGSHITIKSSSASESNELESRGDQPCSTKVDDVCRESHFTHDKMDVIVEPTNFDSNYTTKNISENCSCNVDNATDELGEHDKTIVANSSLIKVKNDANVKNIDITGAVLEKASPNMTNEVKALDQPAQEQIFELIEFNKDTKSISPEVSQKKSTNSTPEDNLERGGHFNPQVSTESVDKSTQMIQLHAVDDKPLSDSNLTTKEIISSDAISDKIEKSNHQNMETSETQEIESSEVNQFVSDQQKTDERLPIYKVKSSVSLKSMIEDFNLTNNAPASMVIVKSNKSIKTFNPVNDVCVKSEPIPLMDLKSNKAKSSEDEIKIKNFNSESNLKLITIVKSKKSMNNLNTSNDNPAKSEPTPSTGLEINVASNNKSSEKIPETTIEKLSDIREQCKDVDPNPNQVRNLIRSENFMNSQSFISKNISAEEKINDDIENVIGTNPNLVNIKMVESNESDQLNSVTENMSHLSSFEDEDVPSYQNEFETWPDFGENELICPCQESLNNNGDKNGRPIMEIKSRVSLKKIMDNPENNLKNNNNLTCAETTCYFNTIQCKDLSGDNLEIDNSINDESGEVNILPEQKPYNVTSKVEPIFSASEKSINPSSLDDVCNDINKETLSEAPSFEDTISNATFIMEGNECHLVSNERLSTSDVVDGSQSENDTANDNCLNSESDSSIVEMTEADLIIGKTDEDINLIEDSEISSLTARETESKDTDVEQTQSSENESGKEGSDQITSDDFEEFNEEKE